jgi:site-specific recombinase XerD
MSAIPQPHAADKAATDWADVAARAPGLARTMGRYLDQTATFLAPTSVDAADNALRQFACWLVATTEVRVVADITRGHVEDFKVWLAQRPGHKPGSRLSANTQRQRLRTLRAFFERIIEWDWPHSPTRNPVIGGDLPPRPEPLPKFLDDRDAAKIMAAARAAADPRDRLVVELLARTGLRASELCGL